MKILIFSWKDIKHPLKGGAEVLTYEIAKRWIENGNEVTIFASYFNGALLNEVIDGIEIIRGGNKFTVYYKAYRAYKNKFKGKYDLVIDEINTIPFFTNLYCKEKTVTLIHQLAKEVWFYETCFPINILGYILEPLYLRLYKNNDTITISNSTKIDLINLGFKDKKIRIMPMGINLKPIDHVESKEIIPTFIYVGRVTKMKRIHHIIEAYKIVKDKGFNCNLWIVGDGPKNYKSFIEKLIKRENIQGVTNYGFVSQDKKLNLMKKAMAIIVTSVREGWGLIVTEANSMGTPAIVYNVHGLRDSTRNDITGIVCKRNLPQELAREMINAINDKTRMNALAENALEWSKEFSWDNAAKETFKILEEYYYGKTIS